MKILAPCGREVKGTISVEIRIPKGFTADLYLDDVRESKVPPFIFDWDTTTTGNGWHQLAANLFDPKGRRAVSGRPRQLNVLSLCG